MKVIAIGATGFIGRYVVTKLVEAGHGCALNSAGGPSPRAWGKPRPLEARARTGRTIPTRVGKTD